MASNDKAEDMLDAVAALSRGARRVSVGDVVEQVGHRGFGPLIFVPALLGASPLGGIPGVPSLLAAVIALIVVQLLLGRAHIWLPRLLRRRNVEADKLKRAVSKSRPGARWLDRWLGRRLTALISSPARMLAALTILGLCVMVPPLEVVPFAALVPMVAIALTGLAITAHDGILMLIAFAASAVALISGLNLLI